jgi:hypothetical protein
MRGEEEKLLLILNLGNGWGWVVSITPRPRFTPGERNPGTHWTGFWVSPRAGLDAGLEEKSSASVGDRTSVVQSVVGHYIDWATPAPERICNPRKEVYQIVKHTKQVQNWKGGGGGTV